jgi:MFS family permease
MDKSNIYNVIHLGLSFLLIFASYTVAQTFQTSSDHAKEGALAVGIIYLAFCLANLALSSYLTRLLGVRLTLIFSSLTYVSFIAANIKYNRWTLYISAFLLGIGAGLIWTAQGVYVAVSIIKHERVNNLVPSSTQGFINGIFFGTSQSCLIIGNLIASLLFHLKYDQWIIFTTMTVIVGIGFISLIFIRPVKMPSSTSKNFFNYFI